MNSPLHHIQPDCSKKEVVKLNALSAKEFGRIFKILYISNPNCLIDIQDSKIYQSYKKFIIDLDLTCLLGNNINMPSILLDKNIVEVVNLLSSGDTTIFKVTEDTEFVKYEFHNNHHSASLLSIEDNKGYLSKKIIFNSNDYCGVPVEIEDIKDLRKYLGKSNGALLIVYNDQLEQVKPSNNEHKSPYTFKKGAQSNLQYEGHETYFSNYFLMFSDKKTKLQLAVKVDQAAEDDRSIWLITEVNMTKRTTIKTYEKLVFIS